MLKNKQTNQPSNQNKNVVICLVLNVHLEANEPIFCKDAPLIMHALMQGNIPVKVVLSP